MAILHDFKCDSMQFCVTFFLHTETWTLDTAIPDNRLSFVYQMSRYWLHYIFWSKHLGLTESTFKKTMVMQSVFLGFHLCQCQLPVTYVVFSQCHLILCFLLIIPLLPLCADHADCHLDECHRYQWSSARWVSRRRRHTVIAVWVRPPLNFSFHQLLFGTWRPAQLDIHRSIKSSSLGWCEL